LIKRRISVVKQHEHDRSLIGKDKYKESIKWNFDNNSSEVKKKWEGNSDNYCI
jgi:hypothetical protein